MEPADRAFLDELLDSLGNRYRLGTDGISLERRPAKETFHPAGIRLGAGGALEVEVTVRCRREDQAVEGRALVGWLEAHAMEPRGFTRVHEERLAMEHAAGGAAGTMMLYTYRGAAADVETATGLIRGFAEGLERTLVAGVHGEEDVKVATMRASRPAPPARRGTLRFDLERGLLSGRHVEVDLDDGLIRTFERRLLGTRVVGEPVRAQTVVAVQVDRTDARFRLTAQLKDGGDLLLGQASDREPLDRSARALAEALRCPLKDG